MRLARLTCAPCWRDDEEMKMAVMKVLHQIHPDMGVDRGGMNAVLDFLSSSLHRIVANADTARETLASSSLPDTSDVPGHWFTVQHFAIAVCQQLPDELKKYSMSEGTKAVCKFRNSSGTAALEMADLADLETKRLDLSTYAGLQFSANAMGVSLARKYGMSFSSDAPVFLAAVIEYLAAEVLHLSGDRIRKNAMHQGFGDDGNDGDDGDEVQPIRAQDVRHVIADDFELDTWNKRIRRGEEKNMDAEQLSALLLHVLHTIPAAAVLRKVDAVRISGVTGGWADSVLALIKNIVLVFLACFFLALIITVIVLVFVVFPRDEKRKASPEL